MAGPACATSWPRRRHLKGRSPTTSVPRKRSRARCSTAVRQALKNEALTPRQRLRRYLDIITQRLEADGFRRGCLIGDFSLEAAPQSEMLRERLAAVFVEWRTPFAACIAEAQASGEIASTFDPEDLADFLLSSWQGAILRMKVVRNADPLERFKTIAFETVFEEQQQ